MALDTLEIFGTEFTNVAGIKATDSNSGTKVYIRPQGTKIISANGTGIDVVNYASVDVNVSGSNDFIITVSKDGQGNLTIDKTFSEVATAYNAGKNIAVKGDEDNYHAGTFYFDTYGNCFYIDGIQFGGDDLNPTMADDSYVFYSNLSDSNGTTMYYEPHNTTAIPSDVASGKTFVNASGFQTGTATPPSGTISITQNGTVDVTQYATANVSVSSGASKNVQVLQSTSRTNASSLTKVLGDLTVSKTGTYDIYWSGGRSNTSTSYTWGTRLYIDGTGYDTENTTWTNNCQSNHLSNVSLTANQKLSVYARGRTGSYYTFAPMLVIVEA